MKTILLPTDFSAKSHNAVEYALELFQGEEVRFLFLNAFNLDQYPTEIRISALQGRLGHQPKRELIGYLDEVKVSLKKHIRSDATFETHVAFGKVANVITKYTEAYPIDYVIMGTEKNNSYFKKFLRSSHTRKVAQKVNCPVIAVPSHLKYKKPEKIVFVTHLKSPIQEDKLLPLNTISQKFNSAITVLNIINDLPSKFQEQQSLKFKNILGDSLNSFSLLQEARVEAALNFFLHQEETDLFVVQHKNNFTGNLFSSGIRQKDHHLLKNVPTLRISL